MKKFVLAALALGFALSAGAASAADEIIRFRGSLETVSADAITVKTRKGDSVKITLSTDVKVLSAGDGKLSDVKPDSYIGTAGIPQPDGSQKALQVTVFAPSLRGTADGHYPWDLDEKSTMTNGAVGSVVGSSERKLQVKYEGGEQTIVVPEDVPVTTVEPGDKSLLKTGAKLVAFTKQVNGATTAVFLIVGRDGVTPSM